MSSWNFNAPQYVDFNKLPKEENIDSYFDLDHENNEVDKLSIALNSSKLSDDNHSDDSGQPITSALQDKTNKMVNNQSSDSETILANLCGSQNEWNKKAKFTVILTKPSRSRPLVTRMKSNTFRQSSPCRSPLAKRSCPTSNPIRPTSGRRKVFARSKSAVSIHKATTTQKSLMCNDEHPETAERRSLRSSMEPLGSSGRGQLLPCSEKSYSLPSVNQLDQNCSDLSSTESNPVSRSQTDLDRNSELDSSNEPISSAAKVGNKNLSQADKVCPGYVTGVSTLKSSEQLEFEKMGQLKKSLEQKRKIAQMSMVKALAVHNQPEVHSTRQPTKPVEFHFATDNRFKEPTKEKPGPLCQEKGFAMQLRQSDPPLQRPRGLTVVQPFNLSEDKKRKRENLTEVKPVGFKFQTMGEKLLQFCTKTPERFRLKKGQTDPPSPRAADVGSRITVAKTPKLTKTRNRKVDALSREEQEELEVQEMKKHQFKALPLNKKILDQRDHMKPIAVKPRTTFKPFKLTAIMRRSEGNLSSSEETRYEFHAQPIPKSVFEPDFIKKEVFKCTIPQSPAFSWKKNPPRASRVSESNLAKLVKEELMFKAPPVPKFDEPFQPVLPHRHTEPEPFYFEERMKETIAKKEKTLRMILEEEAKAREFVANPIPDLSPVLPKKKAIPVTDPVPFHFVLDERGAEKAKKFEEKLEEEQRKCREAATFRAQPVTVLHKDPFVPQKVVHPSIESEPFRLQTEERNVQRQQWMMWKKEKEEEEEVQRQERERQRLEEEEAEVQQLRREAVHRANPIRRYKPLEAREVLPMTEPQSPDFSERLKPRK